MSTEFTNFGRPGSVSFQEAKERGATAENVLERFRVNRARSQTVDEEDVDAAAARRERIDALKSAQQTASPSSDDRLAKFREAKAASRRPVSLQEISVFLTENGHRCEVASYDPNRSCCFAIVWNGARPDKKQRIEGDTMAELFDAIKACVEAATATSTRRESRRKKKRK